MCIPYSIPVQLSYACGQGWYEAQFFCILRVSTFTTRSRRGGRAVECTGLENQQGLIALRGFESHPLRQIRNPAFAGFFVSCEEIGQIQNPVRSTGVRLPGTTAREDVDTVVRDTGNTGCGFTFSPKRLAYNLLFQSKACAQY